MSYELFGTFSVTAHYSQLMTHNSKLESYLRLHRAWTLVGGRNAETRATRTRQRGDHIPARIERKVGNHRVRARVGKLRRRVPVGDSGLIERIEEIQSHLNRPAALAGHEGTRDREVGRLD